MLGKISPLSSFIVASEHTFRTDSTKEKVSEADVPPTIRAVMANV